MTTDRAQPLPLTQDQILAQLQTRGFEEGFQRTPLRDFWGKITSITGEMRQGQRGAFAVALYNYDEVEVIESTEPYTSPIAQLEVSVSTRAKSGMGYLGKSIDNVINAGLPIDAPQSQAKNQDYIIGKMCHMKFTPGHLVPSRDDATNTWGEKASECWELIEIRGEGAPAITPPSAATAPATTATAHVTPGVDANAQALSLLDGKTEQQWHQAVFVDPVVKADTAVIQTIINRTFLTGLETAGTVIKGEDGVYKVA